MGTTPSKSQPPPGNPPPLSPATPNRPEIPAVSIDKRSPAVPTGAVSGVDGNGGGGGCPMKRPDGGYNVPALGRLLGMGGMPKGHPPTTGTAAEADPTTGCDDDTSSSGDVGGSGGCPVQGEKRNATSSFLDVDGSGGCPVRGGKLSSKSGKEDQVQYDVYSQPIDPTNMMPSVANQLPSPQQKEELPTERVQSTIPKVCEMYFAQFVSICTRVELALV